MTRPTPPVCNTGVHPPNQYGQETHLSFFDWYRATVPTSLEVLTKACLDLGGRYPRIVDGKGRFNYHHSRTIYRGNDRVATILHGGPNGHPNVEASGEQAQPLADMLKAGGPHRVTRCDVAVDMAGDGLFEELREAARRIARDNRIKSRLVSSPDDPSAGETVYIGSRDSTVFARIYEKGKAEADRYSDWPPELLKDWVRVELEVKPQKDMKEAASLLQPAEFWGISAWTAQLASEAFNLSPEPIPFHPRRTASDERAFRFMVAQYRNLLRRRCEAIHGGNREALGFEIVSAVFDDEDASAVA